MRVRFKGEVKGEGQVRGSGLGSRVRADLQWGAGLCLPSGPGLPARISEYISIIY